MAKKKSRRSRDAQRLSGMDEDFLSRILRQLKSAKLLQAPAPADPDELLADWRAAAHDMLTEHTMRHQELAKGLRGSVQLDTIDPHRGCRVTLQCGSSTYTGRWQLDLKHCTCDITCNCRHSGLCEHTACVMQWLDEQLASDKSELVAGILGQDPEARRLQQTLSLLQSLTRNAQQAQHSDPESTTAADEQLTRFVWDARCAPGSNRVQLQAIIQQARKTGGWTKGRESSVDSFLHAPREVWSAVDQQLASCVQVERWQPPRLYVHDALRCLAGSDQFTYERQPFELSQQPLELIVREVPGGLQLSTSASDLMVAGGGDSQRRLLDAGHGVLVLVPSEQRAVFFTAPPQAHAICARLTEHQTLVPPAQQPAFLQQLTALRSCMTVHLPESIAGREIPALTQLTLVLQLRRSGLLDAVIQVRDHRQLLQTPGEGLARIHAIVDKQPVQYVRDLAEEVRQAEQLAIDLKRRRGTPLSRWGWRLADADDISELLATAGALVEQQQLVVFWHKDSVSQFDVIGRLSPQNVRVEISRQRDWFGLNGTCRIGDHEIPLKELLTGMHGRPSNGLLEIAPGKWAAVADELRHALRRLADVSLESRGRLQLDASAVPVVSALQAAQIQIAADKHWQKCLQRLQQAEDATFEPPAGLNAELRDYQRDGFRWLCHLAHWGIGGILADDMGLGKTVQALALLLTRVESGPALVIAPTSLGFNWQRECERFTPSLSPLLFRDADRSDLLSKVGEGDVVICSYGLALREAERLKEIHWGTLILDEAQHIKNSNSKTATQIRTLPADWKVALTGTPMENHLGELWSIFHTVAPGVLGSWEQFRRRFATPIEKNADEDRRRALSEVIAPFILRRSKSEVLQDLPARTETNLLVDLSADERRRYDQLRLAAVSELNQLGDDNLSQDQRFRILQMLTRLRQLSCHVRLVDDTWQGSSSKLTVLMEQLEQLKERGHRPLIFSQFTSHLALIREACDAAGISYQYLDGQTTPPQRQERVDAFQQGCGDAFLISLKAGGTGLNLTAADYVIHMDPWWNPAVEDQATDRAHRIGQTQPVMVYRIIARDTIEEQILQLHEDKRDLVDGVLGGTDAAARLSTRELANLIRQGVAHATGDRVP